MLPDLLISYLCSRKDIVRYRNYLFGVPQDLNLRPLLFLLFINDINATATCNNLLFADDLKFYNPIKTDNNCHVLQNNINHLLKWCKTNRLKLNISKCSVTTYKNRTKPISYNYNVSGHILQKNKHI